MDQWLIMLTAVLAVFAAIAIGASARRLEWLTTEADNSLLKIVIRILMPAFIASQMLGNEKLMQWQNVLLPPIVGFSTIVGGFFLAWLVALWTGRWIGIAHSPQRRTFALCTGIYNYAYLPLPLAAALFPDQAQSTLAVLFVHNLGIEIAIWTVGILLISGQLGPGWWRRLFNGPSIAIAVSLLLNFAGLYRFIPQFAYSALTMLGAAAIPMALLLIGAMIADDFREAQFTRGMGVIGVSSILRLGILPAAFVFVAWLLPATEELKRVIVLQAAMPAAVFPIVISRHFGGDPPTAVRIVLGTSLLSLATMPLWLSLGLALIH